jgi:RNA polymerase sigma factor (sigma-70 family)
MRPGDSLSDATSVTLLALLGGEAADRAAWERFVRRYGGRILLWCRHWGLQEADAADVSQEVLLRVARQMQAFRYQPGKSFRAWLKTVARGAWSDWAEASRRPGGGSGDSRVQGSLESVAARDDLVSRIEAEFDLELLEVAMTKVRARVDSTTWEAFRLTALDGLSGVEAAARTGLKVAAVFMARSRVQSMLRDEVRDHDESE